MDDKLTRLISIGKTIHGEAGWQSRLAVDLNLSRQHMSSLMTGARRVTPDIEERLERALTEEIIPRLEKSIAALRAHADDIAEDRKR